MIRREARLRREYIYRKSLEEKQRALDEKRRIVKEAVESNKKIPTHLQKDAIELQKSAEWGSRFILLYFIVNFVLQVFPFFFIFHYSLLNTFYSIKILLSKAF